MSPAASPSPLAAPTAVRHRRSARRLSAGQAADFRAAISAAQAISDDRGFQAWAGIHGLPLPISCVHHQELFLPWHRAYLYLFEKTLQERVPGVTLPWWDWTDHSEGIPEIYTKKRASGKVNSLYDSPIQSSGRERRSQIRTTRAPEPPAGLPSAAEVEAVLENRDFFTFQTQLESLHDGVHLWTGGTMGQIPTAAYDPLFWAHHCMIDRLWYLWQLRHPGIGVPGPMLSRALAPFPMTVADTIEMTQLGYDYAASTAAAKGPGHA